MKNINVHIQQAQQTPSCISIKISTPRHIVVTILKDNEKNIECSKRKMTCHIQGHSNRIYSSSETVEARRQYDDIFKVLKGKIRPTKSFISSKTIF